MQKEYTIDEININSIWIDNRNDQTVHIVNKTSSSIEVFHYADKSFKDKEGKLLGINCKNWYDLKTFNKQFKQ